MFRIVEINKDIAGLTLERTQKNNELIVIQSKNTIDYILKQDPITQLLTPADWFLLFTLFYALFFGRLTIKGLNFYWVAPLAKQIQPIVINSNRERKQAPIQYGFAEKEFRLTLDTQHSLVVKPGWYSLNTAGITKTRFFWDRSLPFASYAMGLVNMTEFLPDEGQLREIKIASDKDPNQDILPIVLNDHPGYVVRHGHVIATCGQDLKMEKKWQFWDWRSWLFGNVRYVYFKGTGTVYISGHGRISTNDSTANSRIKEQHVLGFDSTTPFKPLRTETFTNYWLNDNRLYDVHFPEQGRYLQQQSFGEQDDKMLRSMLEDVLAAIGKLLGF
jgi:uncharacterized protein (AIM24 family)